MVTDNFATTLTSISFAVNAVHVVLMNCLVKYCLWLREIGHYLVVLLRVRVGSDVKGRSFIHEGRLSLYCF